jgi:hypothetical protein
LPTLLLVLRLTLLFLLLSLLLPPLVAFLRLSLLILALLFPTL